MDYLDELESESIYIIREAYKKFKKIALLWSIGKDSTTLVWLARKAFYGKIPFPVMHLDTGHKFPEMYKFREEWDRPGLRIRTLRAKKAIGLDCGAADVLVKNQKYL